MADWELAMNDIRSRKTTLAWSATVVVAIALWGIQSDYFPIPQSVRPSWYVYGWPICFGTCSRDRFGLNTFSPTAAGVDVLVSLVMFWATFVAFRHLATISRQYTLRHLFAMVTGCALVLFLFSGGLHSTLSAFGFEPPRPEISEIARNSRPLRRLYFPLVLPGVVTAMFATGYALLLTLAPFERRKAAAGH